ncbi:MAG: AAA family ATPase [Thaumarchaeota archaeon]|nr:AAA family ATPase [Nitrososphaerota archaeon]
MTSKISSGIAGLDSILKGGMPEGRVVLVLGEPGAGKTILCSQFLHHAAAGGKESVAFVGMNEPKARFMTEMAEFGMDFAQLESAGSFSYLDATAIRRIPEQAMVGRIPVGGKELGLVNLIDMIQETVERMKPKRIVVDSISDLIFRFPLIEERRPVVLDLIETLQSSGATTLLTSELLSTGDDRSLQPEEYLAEGVILLRTLRKGVRVLQVLKMRGSEVDTVQRPYAIKGSGIEVYATEEIY